MSPIQKFYVASSSPYKQYSQTFNSSGTWTCPVGTTQVDVFALGGGGGGGGIYWSASDSQVVTGGGAGGEIVKRTVSVTPGTTYSVFVGAGGAGGYDTFTGQMGGYSAFNPSYTLENGILQQPFTLIGMTRYINSTAGYGHTNPPPFNHSNYQFTSRTDTFSYSTLPAGLNTALGAGDPTKSWRIGSNSSGNYAGTYFWVPVVQNTAYTASGYFAVNSATSLTASVRIEWYNSLYGGQISAVDGTQTSVAQNWTRLSASGTSPSGATYALVRYQTTGSTGTSYVSGPQFEQGSLTSFKSPGYNSTGTVVQNFGLIIEGSSSVIAAGGGGGQSVTNQGSNWFNSTYILRPEYSGSGGGGGYTSTSGSMIGGNGINYAGDSGYSPRYHIANYTTTDASVNYQENRTVFEGIGTGQPAYYSGGGQGVFHVGPAGMGFEGQYGAGGVGGRQSSSNPDSAPYGTTVDGRGGLKNSGAGGSGVYMNPSTSGATMRNGGTGGSGIVILKWMGQG